MENTEKIYIEGQAYTVEELISIINSETNLDNLQRLHGIINSSIPYLSNKNSVSMLLNTLKDRFTALKPDMNLGSADKINHQKRFQPVSNNNKGAIFIGLYITNIAITIIMYIFLLITYLTR